MSVCMRWMLSSSRTGVGQFATVEWNVTDHYVWWTWRLLWPCKHPLTRFHYCSSISGSKQSDDLECYSPGWSSWAPVPFQVPPITGIPNPDGLVSTNPPFKFERQGVRIPVVLASPWIAKVGFQSPHSRILSSVWLWLLRGRSSTNQLLRKSPTRTPNSKWVDRGERYPPFWTVLQHSSVCATIKELFDLPSFLTKRDAWAATFMDRIESAPREKTPTSIPRSR